MVSLNAADIRKLDPFFVGFDRLWKQIDTMHTTSHPNVAGGYPPYNIRQVAEDHYHIEMAIAGFSQEDIEVLLQDGKLTVTGKVADEEEEIVTAKPEPVAVAADSASDDDALSYFQRLAEE